MFRFQQDFNINLIAELVINRKCDEFNIPESLLIVSNLEVATTLFLNAIIPKGFNFVPVSVAPVVHEEIDRVQNKFTYRTELRSLEGYNGSHETCGDEMLWANILHKWVSYGNLKESGGFLNLFHEIVHAWQASYYSWNAKRDFREFCLNAAVRGHIYHNNMVSLRNGEGDLLDLEDRLKIQQSRLMEAGLVYHDQSGFSVVYPDSRLRKVRLSDGFVSFCFYVNKRANLSRLRKRFEECERYAWAYALRIIRFLRTRGVDLEPSLRTLNDFKAIYEPCLQTYQDKYSGWMYEPGMPVLFVRNREGSS